MQPKTPSRKTDRGASAGLAAVQLELWPAEHMQAIRDPRAEMNAQQSVWAQAWNVMTCFVRLREQRALEVGPSHKFIRRSSLTKVQ
jgi:hypothetical protein